MKVTRKVDTVIIEVDIDTAEKIALILGNTIDLTDVYDESFEPLVKKLRDKAEVRMPSPLYTMSVQMGRPIIDWVG